MIFSIFGKPEVLKRLREEINSVIKSDKDINVENFKKLPYLECVMSETSRLFNPAANLFQRELIQDTTLGGVPIEKGVLFDSIMVNQFHDPKIFKDPFEFIPERWESGIPTQEQTRLISMMFGGGPRSCIGKNLALVNSKVMTIKFLQRYASVIEEGIQDGNNR